MATVQEVTAEYAMLATNVFVAGDSGSFDPGESKQLSQLHTAINGALRNFRDRPLDGDNSPKYDAPMQEARDASTQLASAATGALNPALAAIRGAIAALAAVTKPAPVISALRGSLRLRPERRATTMIAAAAGGDSTPAGAGGGDPNYYNKLITLFPAEALTLYGTGVAIFAGSSGRWSKFGVIIFCLLVLLLLRWVANQRKTETGSTDYPAVIVAVLSFLLWATATDPAWLGDTPRALQLFGPYDGDLIRKWASFIGAGFVLVAPALVTPKPDTA